MQRYSVRILPSAYQDILSARDWYIQHNVDLPRKLIEQVSLAIESIRNNPFAFAIRYRDVRVANISIFPYGVHYFIKEDINAIVIIAVFHTAISPDKWKRKYNL